MVHIVCENPLQFLWTGQLEMVHWKIQLTVKVNVRQLYLLINYKSKEQIRKESL